MTTKRAGTLDGPGGLFNDCSCVILKLYSVKSGNTCLSVANSEGKTNDHCAKPRAFRQAATGIENFRFEISNLRD
jgi:hypothetical protein